MKRYLFLDRDGTVIVEPEDQQVDSLEKLQFYPGVITGLHRIQKELDYSLVMVTNQDGLGTASFPEETFWPAHRRMLSTLANEGIEIDEVLISRGGREEDPSLRKPNTALLDKYLRESLDRERSFVVGDRGTDIQLAVNMGIGGVLLGQGHHPRASLVTRSWKRIYHFLKFSLYRARVKRKTTETEAEIRLTLYGSGNLDISTGIGFFDHMLEQLAFHSGWDLTVKTTGDLEVDEHHTVEDTALALGSAFREALGSNRGVERYGFMLPMDESLARVAVDISGRSRLIWQVDMPGEKIGGVATEMFPHFFRSFAETARMGINIKAEGENGHHLIESVFKAFGRSLSQAASPSRDSRIPSTKGVL